VIKKIESVFLPVLLALLVLLLLFFSLMYKQALFVESLPVYPVSDVMYELETGDISEITLPALIEGLSPRTKIIITTKVEVKPEWSIYIKSVFAPLKVYINDELLYEYGQRDTYPWFLNDPPTAISILKLPENNGTISIRAEYESLTQRDSLSIPAFYVGEHAAQLNRMLNADAFSFLFSLVLILLGIIMTIIAVTFMRRVPTGKSFLWLGLFSLAAGFWVFGECDFASRIFPYPSVLYLLDYMGLFLVAIPFLHFGLVMLSPKNDLLIRIMLWVHYSSVTIALILQVTGLVDFIKTLYWFHIITPLAFLLIAFYLLWEWFRYKNIAAKRFASAVLLLALSTLLELVNYWLRLTQALTVFFQLGVLLFIVFLAIVSGYYVRESLNALAEKNRLELEMINMERQLLLQSTQYQKMADDENRMKKERHDFRHHLLVLRSYKDKQDKLDSYIDQLIKKIPQSKRIILCENYAINAVCGYYYDMAVKEDIDIKVKIEVPKDLSTSIESDLSVIIGNLMENAVEACKKIKEKQAFINLKALENYDILSITCENSYEEEVRKKGDIFYSSKQDREGIGTSSIIAAAKKNSGNAKFTYDNNVFVASVYLKII